MKYPALAWVPGLKAPSPQIWFTDACKGSKEAGSRVNTLALHSLEPGEDAWPLNLLALKYPCPAGPEPEPKICLVRRDEQAPLEGEILPPEVLGEAQPKPDLELSVNPAPDLGDLP